MLLDDDMDGCNDAADEMTLGAAAIREESDDERPDLELSPVSGGKQGRKSKGGSEGAAKSKAAPKRGGGKHKVSGAGVKMKDRYLVHVMTVSSLRPSTFGWGVLPMRGRRCPDAQAVSRVRVVVLARLDAREELLLGRCAGLRVPWSTRADGCCAKSSSSLCVCRGVCDGASCACTLFWTAVSIQRGEPILSERGCEHVCVCMCGARQELSRAQYAALVAFVSSLVCRIRSLVFAGGGGGCARGSPHRALHPWRTAAAHAAVTARGAAAATTYAAHAARSMCPGGRARTTTAIA